MKLPKILVLLLLFQSLLALSQTQAQDRAVLAFEAKPGALMESDLADVLQLDASLRRGRPNQWQSLLDADSVEGILCVPESIEDIKRPQGGDSVPFDFYVRFEFDNAAPVTQMNKAFASRSAVEEKDDYTEMRPKSGGNIYLAFGDKWIVFATDSYDVDKKSLQRISPELKDWKKDPKALAQAAGDIKSARDFLEQFSDVIREEARPLVFLIPLFDQADYLTLTVKPDADEMLRLYSESKDEKTADKFRESMTGLISMGKFLINQSNQRDPISDMAFEVLENLRPEQDGNEIELVMNRPEGFDDRMKEAIATARDAADKMRRINDVKQVALAMHNYADSHKRFPFLPGKEDSAGLSWRVRVLPYIEEMELYQMFDLQESWDSATNKRLLELQPALYGGEEDDSMVCWVQSDATYFRDLTDGTSNTIAFIVVPKQMNWTEPKDVSIAEAVEVFQATEEGEPFIAGFYDGSVRKLDRSLKLDQFKAMLTPAGGEVIER